MGYPHSSYNNLTSTFHAIFKSGVITMLEPNYIFMDRTLFPGSSGGPIFDISGNILVIVTKLILFNNQLPVEITFGIEMLQLLLMY